VDEDGNVITDENGNPVTNQGVAEATMERPGEGRWANYDFLRGERPIFNSRWNIEDVDNPPALIPNPAVRVGRIPSNIEFGKGNVQVVQLDGVNTLEFTTETQFQIPLTEPLPEDFSLEFNVHLGAPNMFVYVHFEPFWNEGVSWADYPHHYLDIWRGGGIYLHRDRISGADQMQQLALQLTPVKFQVDDGYAILYVAGERVAQVPNFSHPVGSTALEFQVTATQANNAYIRDIRIDYGVEDPHETLEAEGTYTTRSIFFDFGSARLRPESTPELERIRRMLAQYGEPVVIEGHTDAIGSDEDNLDLSQRRADAVRDYLVEHGADAGLISTEGKGESEPVADNDTDDGRQANRRVVLRAAAE
jgi:outer membrane protein OmpA-like peptidoglycan-associated protein